VSLRVWELDSVADELLVGFVLIVAEGERDAVADWLGLAVLRGSKNGRWTPTATATGRLRTNNKPTRRTQRQALMWSH
jgi:hypothetical protein